MAKQNFLGLVKVTGSITNYNNIADKTGKLIFAQVTDGDVTKYIINANGIEYNIATAEVFKSLEARVKSLEDWKVVVDGSIGKLVEKDTEIDASISRLNSSVFGLETWKAVVDASQAKQDASIANHETRIVALEDASAALADRIADVSQHAIDNDASIVALKTKDAEIDGSIGDISTRLSNVGITAADNKLTVNGKDVALTGSDYVTVTAADNSVNVSLNAEKIQDGGGAEGHEKLATKGYVDEQMGELTQALVFRGSVSNEQPLPTKNQKVGDTYVASKAMTNPKADAGDLFIWNGTGWTQVERNLDGAVQAGEALGADYVILGSGNQTIKASTLSISELNTAIANANSALQNVTASTLSNFVTVAAVKDASAVNVSVGVTTHEVSTATSDANGLATALDVKEYVDAQAADIKVQATLNSSTTEYVDAAAVVDDAGRVISASVGVKTATLVDASNGKVGLAIAKDVYDELTAVEQTMAEANTKISSTVGLNPDYSVTWSDESGIATNTSIVKAIEEVAKKADEAKQSGVTEFGGKKGAISIDTTGAADGSVAFAMDGSTLKGTVNGWSGLVNRVAATETSISEVSTRLNDLSTYVHNTVDASIDALQAKDVEIDASIDRLDASVNALEAKLSKHAVKSIEGEAAITTRPNDDYVAVAAAAPDANGKVVLDASVQLAETVDLNGITGATTAQATGLATDATVKDYVAYALAWEVIGE